MDEERLKVGDTVTYRGGFGLDAPKVTTIEALEITDSPREKYGELVESVSIDLVRANRVMFELSDGHWCYSDQIIL